MLQCMRRDAGTVDSSEGSSQSWSTKFRARNSRIVWHASRPPTDVELPAYASSSNMHYAPEVCANARPPSGEVSRAIASSHHAPAAPLRRDPARGALPARDTRERLPGAVEPRLVACAQPPCFPWPAAPSSARKFSRPLAEGQCARVGRCRRAASRVTMPSRMWAGSGARVRRSMGTTGERACRGHACCAPREGSTHPRLSRGTG